MLETWNLVCKHKRIFSFRKCAYQGPLSFADVNIFLAKIVPLLKAIVGEQCQRFFSSVFSFCEIKVSWSCKYKFYRPCVRYPASGSGIRLQINHQLKKTLLPQFADMKSSSIFLTLPYFSCQVQLLLQVSCQYHDWLWSYDNFRL